jgi:hypothetical protein
MQYESRDAIFYSVVATHHTSAGPSEELVFLAKVAFMFFYNFSVKCSASTDKNVICHMLKPTSPTTKL